MMSKVTLFPIYFLLIQRWVTLLGFSCISFWGLSQEVRNAPKAFARLSSKPIVILITNDIQVPSERGHFQGIQILEKKGLKKAFISGSSRSEAYLLQVDLKHQKTETLISLMTHPFRHAGGLQVSSPYLIVGIEDNQLKTTSKVCIYNYQKNKLNKAVPSLTIERRGEPKRFTAGASGLLKLKNDYLVVVSNWDSRNWDFYTVDPETKNHKMNCSFQAPEDWAGYQSINLIKDRKAIYALGFYREEASHRADLILISKLKAFKPIMKKLSTKAFNTTKDVDFNGAAGLQVDIAGKLHIWASQKNTSKEIALNKFSQQ